MTTTEIPAFLAHLIDEIAEREGFVAGAYTISASSGSSLGDGYQGVVSRVAIEGQRSGQPGSQRLALICKQPPIDMARREMFNSREVFEREIYIYQTVLPMLEKFQRDLGVGADKGFYRFPKCYGTRSDPATLDYAVAMEDLKEAGYEMWDRFEALDFAHASLALAELGKLHALSFVLRDQRPDLLAVFKDLRADALLAMAEQEVSRPMWTMNYEMAVSTLEEDEVEMRQKLGTLAGTFMQRMRDCLINEADTEPFTVLNHGDFWNNNMMYQHTGEGAAKRPQTICLIDWQMTQFSSPAIDLMYFLFSSTEHELRHQHFWDLIRVYYDHLASTVRALGSDPESLFRYEDLQAQLRRFGQYAMVMAPMLVQVVTARPEELPDLDEMSRKIKANTMENFEGFVKKDNPVYRKRMGEVVRDYFALGFDM